MKLEFFTPMYLTIKISRSMAKDIINSPLRTEKGYERLAVTFLGLIHLASITILWRVLK
jgi:hypothetical protein